MHPHPQGNSVGLQDGNTFVHAIDDNYGDNYNADAFYRGRTRRKHLNNWQGLWWWQYSDSSEDLEQ